jgi:acetyl-CoA synthetase
MTKGLWKDKERFVETYWNRFPGIWFHGDFAMVDEDGHWYLLGRCDDLIKTSGKRIGPSEIEEIIIKIEGIKEAAAIGAPDPIHGEVVVCFVAAKDNLNEIENKIRNDISYKLGKSFIPKYVFFVEDLPKTNSGKISRDILRSIYKKEDITNKIQSISNPESLGLIRYAIQNYS